MKSIIQKRTLKHKAGSIFIVVIGVLAIIIFAATSFMTTTIQESRETSMSVRGLHAASLAEASLERAMRIITQNVNKVDKEDSANFTDKNFGFKLRYPAIEGGSSMEQGGNFGSDKELSLAREVKNEIELKKDDLQTNDERELDDLVEYMTDGGAVSYEVTVKAKIDRAFRNSPGKNYSDFQVPGVDIGWNTRYDVKNFLEGNGFTAFELKFPDDWSWLDISIPVEIAGIKICDINITKVLDFIKIPINGKEYKISDFTKINTIVSIFLNDIVGKAIGKPNLYPFEIKFDKLADKMKNTVQDLWPISIAESQGQYLEKYGQMSLECEAKITYQDKYTSARRITAVKDFKVADCEPPAPMYSLFINNLSNKYVDFNNYGGQFVVNNYDYSGLLGKIKEVFTGTSGVSQEEAESREYPGLIRVNYVDESESKTNPIICNVSCVGDTNATTIDDDDSGVVKRFFQGAEVALIACPKTKMAVVGRKYNINAEVQRKDTETGKMVPVSIKGPKKDETPANVTSPFKGKIEDYSLAMKTDTVKDFLKRKPGSLINLMPSIGKMSTNILSFGITMLVKPMAEKIQDAVKDKTGVDTSFLSVPDCFENWEMPNMGTDWQFYTIPTTGTSVNKSHLFGYGALHPTMTKEIEGNVMKSYKQWSMCIIGMKSVDRLPLLPFPPTFLPPFPIPVWKSATVFNKYAYNADTFLPNDENGQADNKVHEYDPKQLENMAPNLYTNEQYAKKATYYYESPEAFEEDLPNRTTKIDDKTVFILNGITYISGSLGSENKHFTVDGDTLYVAGKGMIVVSGNVYLGCNIKVLDRSDTEPSVFTLMCRSGGLIISTSDKKIRFEGSLYTDYGIFLNRKSSLHIVGNWVTNDFNKMAMGGTVVVDYVSSRVRTSLGSLHPTKGKYDPKRYYVSFSPTWAAWRAH